MAKSRTLLHVIGLTAIGFAIPVAMLLPVEYARAEFGVQFDWNKLLDRLMPPTIGCSGLFLVSALTSSTPRKTLTFVQSLFLHGVTFIASSFAFVPVQNNKVTDPQLSRLAWIPFLAVLLLFVALMVIGNIPVVAETNDSDPVADEISDKHNT